jgi:hypothetical protein
MSAHFEQERPATAVRIQSIPVALSNNEDTDLEFSSPEGSRYDLGGFFDSEDPTHIVPPVRGIYVVGLHFDWYDLGEAAGIGSRNLSVTPGGFEINTPAVYPAGTHYGDRVTDTTRLPSEPIRVYATQDSGVEPSFVEDELNEGVQVQVTLTLALLGTAPEPE